MTLISISENSQAPSTYAKSSKMRVDIQALRGFAVLIVLFYHAKFDFFERGFLGVDVFFVISGYLITRLVKEGIENGTFTFSDFYFRRAKRLLPSAYVTIICSIIAAPFFLASTELSDFRAQVIGAVTFTVNMVLWSQSGYFGGTAELKPLLHMWSLAIEEQYYFLLPAILFFLPSRFWKLFAAMAVLVSLGLCVFLLKHTPSAAFYLLPTRAWELALGSVGVLFAGGPRLRKMVKIAFIPAVVVLLVLPFVSISALHPGPDAFLICLATLVVIVRQHSILQSGPALRAMARVGDLSYSLYLVHWPVFAFFNNSWMGASGISTPIVWKVSLIALSLVLAVLLNRFVEEPARRLQIRKSYRVLFRTVGASLIVIISAFGFAQSSASQKDYAHLRRPNQGLSPKCGVAKIF